MILYLLEVYFSWPFWAGAAVSCAGHWALCRRHARWLDKHHPLPDGARHAPRKMPTAWLAGLLAVTMLGYGLLQTERAHADTIALAAEVKRCNTEYYRANNARILLNEEDARLARRYRDKLNELDGASADWLRGLLTAPPEIDTPAEQQQWLFDVTHVYNDRAVRIRADIAAIEAEQDKLAADRRDRPLPDLTCGK